MEERDVSRQRTGAVCTDGKVATDSPGGEGRQ